MEDRTFDLSDSADFHAQIDVRITFTYLYDVLYNRFGQWDNNPESNLNLILKK